MADYAEKAQHLRRCSPRTIRQPRVACTIVCQPWAIENTTLISLKWIYQMIIPFSLTRIRTEIQKKNP